MSYPLIIVLKHPALYLQRIGSTGRSPMIDLFNPYID